MTTPRRPRGISRWVWPLAADLVCVLALAVGGQRSHEPGDSAWVVFTIMWPFALAAGLAHVSLASRGRRSHRVWPEGFIVLGATYLLGMILRAVSGRGLAPEFLVVAGVFLALTMLGWRVAVHRATRLGATRSQARQPWRARQRHSEW